MMIHFNWYKFEELTLEKLYALLKLRSDVFVVEQNCIYSDIDGKDQEALHLLGHENNQILAYLRLFPPSSPNDTLVFGRVVIHPSVRKKSYGKLMMTELLNYCSSNYAKTPIKCSAQFYLKKFYERFDFKAFGDIYNEDGIPHIGMIRA